MRAVDFMGWGGERTPRHSSSHCWERGCARAGQSPENFPTHKIFLPPHSGARGRGGEEDFMGRAQPCAGCLLGKKMCGKRWGLLCSAFFTRKIFPAADRRDYAREKSGVLHVTGNSRCCGWGGKSPEQGKCHRPSAKLSSCACSFVGPPARGGLSGREKN